MGETSEVVLRLARALAESPAQHPFPLRLCHACGRILGVSGGSITLAYGEPERVTLATTDEVAARIESLQEVLGQGPGPDAYRTGVPETVQLTGPHSERWPLFAAAAVEAVGPVSIFALPIRPQGRVLGVLTLYRSPPGELAEELPVSQFLADAVGVALLRDFEQPAPAGGGHWLARMQVNQAVGMVIAQLGLTTDDALALLRAHAYAENTTVERVAENIVRRRLDFSLPDAPAADDSGNGPT